MWAAAAGTRPRRRRLDGDLRKGRQLGVEAGHQRRSAGRHAQELRGSGRAVYRGKFAGKITVHPDDTFSADQIRVDIQHPSTLTDEGKTPGSPATTCCQPTPAAARSSPSANRMGLPRTCSISGSTPSRAAARRSTSAPAFSVRPNCGQPTSPPASGTRSHCTCCGRRTRRPAPSTSGSTACRSSRRRTPRPRPTTNSLFFQTGLHRRKIYNVTTTDTLYFDDFIEADAMADAGIAAPTPDNGTGGTGGAAGMGGAAGAGGGSAAGAGGSSSPLGGAGGIVGSAGTTSSGAASGGMTTSTGGTGPLPTAGTSGTRRPAPARRPSAPTPTPAAAHSLRAVKPRGRRCSPPSSSAQAHSVVALANATEPITGTGPGHRYQAAARQPYGTTTLGGSLKSFFGSSAAAKRSRAIETSTKSMASLLATCSSPALASSGLPCAWRAIAA